MKKRLIPKQYIKKAYTKGDEKQDLNMDLEPMVEKIDKLPKEMFQIIGEVISFIEKANTIEGDKNENKQ